MLYKLQTKLTTLTGEDPLKDKNVSFIGPQVSPHKITRQLFDGKNDSSYMNNMLFWLLYNS